MKTQIVRGEIVWPPQNTPTKPVDVLAYVEDISRADAPAKIVGEQLRHNIWLRTGEALPFEIEIPDDKIDPRSLYSVRVHIDTSQSGDITLGDFVSTQTYPVLTRGYGSEAKVTVQRV